MFQCASSFVIRLRLGGKSYQAGEESKIRAHAKGLGELVDLIQKVGHTNSYMCDLL